MLFNPPETSSQIIEYTIFPEDAHEEEVIITSSDNDIVSVTLLDGENKFIAEAGSKAGKASIKVALVDKVEGKEIAGTCAVEVNLPKSVTSVKLSKNSLKLDIDQEEVSSLEATVLPLDATNKEVNFSSSDPTVAEYVDGKIIPHKVGEATITATTVDGGYTDSCVVNVIHTPVKKVFIDCTLLYVDLGSNAHLHYYGGGKSSSYPGIALDTSKKITKDKIFLSDRTNADCDLPYWEVPNYSEYACFTNIVSEVEANKWDNFSLLTNNLFEPYNWEGGYSSSSLYEVSLTNKDGVTNVEYTIPAWSMDGYTAPTPTLGYKWVYKGTNINFVNKTSLSSDIELEEVLIGATHKVTYYSNGATGQVPLQNDVEEGTEFIVGSAQGLEYLGYVFAGWSDGKDIYFEGDSYVMGTEDVSLLAQWELINYQIKIGSNFYDMELNEGTEYKTVDNVSVSSGDIVEVYLCGLKDSAYTAKNTTNNNCWNDSNNVRVCQNMTAKIYIDVSIETKTIFCGGLKTDNMYLSINETVMGVMDKNETPLDPSFLEYYILDVEISKNGVIKFVNTLSSTGAGNAVVFSVLNLNGSSRSGFEVKDGKLMYTGEDTITIDVYLKLKYQQDEVYIE